MCVIVDHCEYDEDDDDNDDDDGDDDDDDDVVVPVVGMSIQLEVRAFQLDLVTSLSATASVRNDTGIEGGLLGNMNNDPDDDLTTRDGVTIDKDSNNSVIYYDFGETCKYHSIYTCSF